MTNRDQRMPEQGGVDRPRLVDSNEAARMRVLDDDALNGESLTRALWPTEAEIDGFVEAVLDRADGSSSELSEPVQTPTSTSTQVDSHPSKNNLGLPACARVTILDGMHRVRAIQLTNARPSRHSLELTVTKAYTSMHVVYPEDHVIIDEAANDEFMARCRLLGATVSTFVLNKALLNARKAGQHAGLRRAAVPLILTEGKEDVLFASDLAARALQWMGAAKGESPSIDRIICDDFLKHRFDWLATKIFPGRASYLYRLAMLALRKSRRQRSQRIALLSLPEMGLQAPLWSVDPSDVSTSPGVYFLMWQDRIIYCSWAGNLQERTKCHLQFGGETILPDEASELIPGRMQLLTYPAPHWGSYELTGVANRYKPHETPSLNYMVC